jgi:hypothetical protein
MVRCPLRDERDRRNVMPKERASRAPARRARLGLGLLGLVLLGGSTGCPGDKACEVDADCGGEVCARSHECLPASQVRRVQVRWTIRGAEASAATCEAVEPLTIQFVATREDALKYEPLACSAGLFTIDKMPSRMRTVEIDGPRVGASSGIPADGQVQLDLR